MGRRRPHLRRLPLQLSRHDAARLARRRTTVRHLPDGVDAAAKRLPELEAEIASLREETAAMRSKWQTERDKLAEVKQLNEQLDNVRAQAKAAERAGDLNRAAELTYGTLRDLESARDVARETLSRAPPPSGVLFISCSSRSSPRVTTACCS